MKTKEIVVVFFTISTYILDNATYIFLPGYWWFLTKLLENTHVRWI